jgi:ferric-dicitrate binding protein FerR (iron transport regulator)
LNFKGEKVVEFKSSRLNIFIGSGAAIAVFFTILYIGMFNTGKYSPEIETGIDETELVLMPDSSMIFLNSSSKVKYHCNKLTGNRNVVLHGEALFEVNSGKRFRVDFDGGQINVSGTSFYLVAYNDQHVSVDCIEGSLKFSYGRYGVDLEEGQGVKVFKGIVTGPYFVDKKNINERMQGIYHWDKIDVEELLFHIGCRFNYNIEYERHVGKRNFSGKIDLSELHNSLSIVSYAMDLDYEINSENQTIIINAK